MQEWRRIVRSGVGAEYVVYECRRAFGVSLLESSTGGIVCRGRYTGLNKSEIEREGGTCTKLTPPAEGGRGLNWVACGAPIRCPPTLCQPYHTVFGLCWAGHCWYLVVLRFGYDLG